MYYKLGQACVTNWGSFVLFQIRANVVTNWGKMYYKLGQVLQIRAIITNWGITGPDKIKQSGLQKRKYNYEA